MSNPLAPVADWFLLRQAERRAAEIPSERLERIRKLSAAGNRRLTAAIDLRETAPEIGLILLREASLFLIAAFGESRGQPIDLDAGVAAAWQALQKMRSTASQKDADAEVALAAETLSTTDPLAFDEMPRDDLLSRFSSVETALDWLCKQIDARSPKEIRRARIVRVIVASAVVVVALAWAVNWLITAPNIALHKPTTASSFWPGSPAEGLTNGVNEGGYAVATNFEHEPWIRLDLENVYKISSIVIVPRGDGHAEEQVPSVVETSENGTEWSEVARRTETFSQLFPWKVSASGKRARYIRVRALKQTVLALAEIEVRGRR
jgi:hypothetical protein